MRVACLVLGLSALVIVGCTVPSTLITTPQISATASKSAEAESTQYSTAAELGTPGNTPVVGVSPAVTPIPTRAPPPLDGSESILDTALGQAVRLYNSNHASMIVVYVVGASSEGLDREMYDDLVARGWRMMGPEDIAGSEAKPGWPYVVIARDDTLSANSVEVWGYVLEHEFVHMVAAANLTLEGVNLAEVMREAEGSFTHRARFHEVCADYYPLDTEGNHRPVAESYGAMSRMPDLLSALAEYALDDLEYDPPAHFDVLPITGIPLVDAACVWDREAMERIETLYDAKRGDGAFEILFPLY